MKYYTTEELNHQGCFTEEDYILLHLTNINLIREVFIPNDQEIRKVDEWPKRFTTKKFYRKPNITVNKSFIFDLFVDGTMEKNKIVGDLIQSGNKQLLSIALDLFSKSIPLKEMFVLAGKEGNPEITKMLINKYRKEPSFKEALEVGFLACVEEGQTHQVPLFLSYKVNNLCDAIHICMVKERMEILSQLLPQLSYSDLCCLEFTYEDEEWMKIEMGKRIPREPIVTIEEFI